MGKIVLVLLNNVRYSKNKTLNKIATGIRTLFDTFIPNKVDIKQIDNDMQLYIIKVFNKENKLTLKINRIYNFLVENKFDAIVFDEYIIDKYGENIKKITQTCEIPVCNGEILRYSVILKVLKKITKDKGIDIDGSDALILCDDIDSNAQMFIRYLCNKVKYLTVVCSKESHNNEIFDSIYENLGFSIRRCSDINKCINESNILINLTSNSIVTKIKSNNNVVVYNHNHFIKDYNKKKNIIILKQVDINISNIYDDNLKIINKYSLCEMYILSKTDKLHLLKSQKLYNETDAVYTHFKKLGFDLGIMEGINL